MSSIALALPTRRARRCVPPVPGHAELHFREADPAGVLLRHANVRRQGDLEPPADAVTVQRGNHELRRLLEPVHRLVGVQAEAVFPLGLGLREHRDVRPGAEELLARATDDDDVHGRVHARGKDRIVDLAHHLVRVGVRRRVAQLDLSDPVLCRVVDL
jgi:hypothetical protein